MPRTSAVIVAAGSSRRMNGIDKMLTELCGIPVLARAMMAFQQNGNIDEIVVVTRPASVDRVNEFARVYGISKLAAVVPGGETRGMSVRNGVGAVSPECEYIAIQDGARPLVSQGEINRCIADAEKYGASIVAVPVKDTIKVAHDGTVSVTPERKTLFAAQTPQVFERKKYEDAMDKAFRELDSWTDDSQIMEHAGYEVHISVGSPDNIKITSPGDIYAAEAIINGGKPHEHESGNWI